MRKYAQHIFSPWMERQQKELIIKENVDDSLMATLLASSMDETGISSKSLKAAGAERTVGSGSEKGIPTPI